MRRLCTISRTNRRLCRIEINQILIDKSDLLRCKLHVVTSFPRMQKGHRVCSTLTIHSLYYITGLCVRLYPFFKNSLKLIQSLPV